MKLNPVTSIIAVGISLIIAYGFYSFGSTSHKIILAGVSLVFSAATLIPALGLSLSNYRKNMNMRATAFVFFIVAVITLSMFSFAKIGQQAFIVFFGILFLLYLLIFYYLVRPAAS